MSGVRRAVNAWLDRIGPGSVEKHFVKAHENILKTFNNEERAKAYEQTGLTWKKWGKALGITAMVIDSGLAGLGIAITQDWVNNPRVGRQAVRILGERTDRRTGFWDKEPTNPGVLRTLYLRLSPNIFISGVVPNDLLKGNFEQNRSNPTILHEREYASRIGTITSIIPGLATLLPLTGIGPMHMVMHLIATGAETVGKMKARSKITKTRIDKK